MQKIPWAAFLWPGLPQLWLRGQWAGLAKALGAAIVLCAVLLGTFGWSELISAGMRNTLWIAVALFWTASAVAAYVQTRRRTNREQLTPAKDTFTQALDLYLKGDYFEAECLLVEMLARNERDLDARLMLAALYRHNRRYDEAAKQLDTLARFEGAEKWRLEIESERSLIAEGKIELERREENLPAIEPKPRLSHAA
ncbi:MAG: tetratricopeptide repeat protein [Pirellulales bacterium]|nr:tetratricopeptide repeat protein [Pirellulales bacterium]